MTDSKYGFLPEEDGYGEEELQSEEIVSKLRQAEVLIAQGSKIPDVVRTLGMTQVTYYHWRREFGGDALMLPAIDAAFLAGRAFRLQRASAAFSGPVAMERSSLLEARISISERHSRRTAIYVLIGKIDEVILAESPCGLRIRDEWLGHVRRGTDGLAGENFLAAE